MKHTSVSILTDKKGIWQEHAHLDDNIQQFARRSAGKGPPSTIPIGNGFAVVNYAAKVDHLINAPVFCTLTEARRIAPGLESYQLENLVDMLGLTIPSSLRGFAQTGQTQKTAVLTDVLFNALLGRLLSKGIHMRELMKYHTEPQWQERLTWGQYQGYQYNDLPDWFANKALDWKLDIDTRYNLTLVTQNAHTAMEPV